VFVTSLHDVEEEEASVGRVVSATDLDSSNSNDPLEKTVSLSTNQTASKPPPPPGSPPKGARAPAKSHDTETGVLMIHNRRRSSVERLGGAARAAVSAAAGAARRASHIEDRRRSDAADPRAVDVSDSLDEHRHHGRRTSATILSKSTDGHADDKPEVFRLK
jgi:hypothetical protein